MNFDNKQWIPELHLTTKDRHIIKNGEELNDLHVTTAMNLIQNEHPIIVQPPSIVHATGFDYCPVQTIQILHNGAHHWLLLSSLDGTVSIYDSLNMHPTNLLLKQMTQLFSPDDALPVYKQHECHKQVGGTDCGVFAIAYAVDALRGNEPQNIRYNQSKMRDHLIHCFETGKITSFPKYETGDDKNVTISSNKDTEGSSWLSPKRYNLRSSQKTHNTGNKSIPLRNQYTPLSSEAKTQTKSKLRTAPTPPRKHQISQVVHNLSKVPLTNHELSLLEKGLNFCPSTKDVNTEELLDDTFAYCRKLRLKHHFGGSPTENGGQTLSEEDKKSNVDDERCPMKSTYSNPYFNPPTKYTPPNLEKYIAATKTSIVNLISKSSACGSNLSTSERETLESLKMRTDITITSADKGGKVVVMDKEMYINQCQTQLENPEFYQMIDNDSTHQIANEIQSEVSDMLTNNIISKKESLLLTENLNKPRLPIFYGLPKIHKSFQEFPPLRPIVSGFSSCTSKLSEYLDTFLKYQARKCSSYIRDTKHFISKLNQIKSIPNDAILVTMDVGSLYTNIDHQEGAEACYEALETRKNKTIPSSLLRRLILLVLKSNIFRFNDSLYQQIKGTAMGTPMAVNYANLFLNKFETQMLNAYERKTNLRPLIWMRYIDDIFFIWHHDETSLQDFITFCDNYSTSMKMKSKIKFETNFSTESVNFLDVNVSMAENSIKTSLYTKQTDAHLYLNAKSSHPRHIIKNLPKGQFIRVRRICSEDSDFDRYACQIKKYFILRGFTEKKLQETIDSVRTIPREELLKEKEKKAEKDPHAIFVCTWHPKLKELPSILNKSFEILKNDPKLCKTFHEKPIVAFRRKKNFKNILCKNDVRKKEVEKVEKKCKGCQLCRIMSHNTTITNKKNGETVKTKPGSHCKSTGIVYAIHCKKCEELYIGETGKTMSERYGGHKYDIKNRPENCDLAKHCCKTDHNLEQDLEVFIIEHGIHNLEERRRIEDKYICKLQTLTGSGMNKDLGAYAKEMYTSWSSSSASI